MTIRALIEAVERGDGASVLGAAKSAFRPENGAPSFRINGVYMQAFEAVSAAFHRSLDAALALHEALLPGWRVSSIWEMNETSSGWCAIITPRDYSSSEVSALDQPTAARAWLLAILRAVEAEDQP